MDTETLIFTTPAEPISLPGLMAGGLTGNMNFGDNVETFRIGGPEQELRTESILRTYYGTA